MPRKTDSNNPADWLWIAESDLSVIRLALAPEIGFSTCRGKLAEVLEKILKAELIRLGWSLERTHDLNRLAEAMEEFVAQASQPAASRGSRPASESRSPPSVRHGGGSFSSR